MHRSLVVPGPASASVRSPMRIVAMLTRLAASMQARTTSPAGVSGP